MSVNHIASPPKIIDLSTIRADGWFDRVGEGVPAFSELCRIVGQRFVGFAVIAGVRVTGLTIDTDNLDNSSVDFTLAGDDDREFHLSVEEFRQRLSAAMLTEDPEPEALPPEPSSDDIQALLGPRFVLIAALYRMRLMELRVPSEGPPTVVYFENDGQHEVDLPTFWARIRTRIRGEMQGPQRVSRLLFDPEVYARAKKAADEGDWELTAELLGVWPGPLSLLFRTAEGQNLDEHVRAEISEGLGLLGQAYIETNRLNWAEEVIRLGIQWGNETRAAPLLFVRLGRGYAAQGRHGEAIGMLRRGLSLGANPSEVLGVLAESYAACGRHVAAACCLERAKKAGANPPEATAVQAEIDETIGPAWKRFQEIKGA